MSRRTRRIWTTSLSILTASAVLVGAFFVSGPKLQAASAPNIITYQGRVLDSNSVPVTSASVSMQFALYDASAAGTCLWSNADSACASTANMSVTLTDGLFTVNLGDTGASFAAIPDTVFADNASVYLQVTISGETLSPRKRLYAAPYALNASTIDGIDSTELTLDKAYDANGAGTGRVITVDTGAVELTGSNAADYTLEVTTSGAGGSLYVSNTDGTSEALYVASDATTIGTAVQVTANGLTEGEGLKVFSSSSALTSGTLITAQHNATYTGSETILGSYGLLNVRRSLVSDGFGETLTVSKPLASFNDSVTNSLGANSSHTADAVVITTSSSGSALQIKYGGTGTALRVDDSVSTDSTPFIIDSDGNVAIGATSTTDKLYVAGTTTVTGLFSADGNVVLGDAAADTLTFTGTIQGASPLAFEGTTTGDGFQTTFAITDPTADHTITFPASSITVNAAADISGTTLASNVVASSLTSVGTLTSLTVSGLGTFNGGVYLGDASTLSFEGATANDFETSFAITDPTADRTLTFPDATGTVAITTDITLDTAYDNESDKTLDVDSATGLIFDLRTTGDLLINDFGTTFATFSNTGTVTFANLFSANGDVNIGNATTDTVTITAEVDSNIIPDADETYDLGSDTLRWNDVYIGQSDSDSSSLHIGGTSTAEAKLYFVNATQIFNIDTDGQIILNPSDASAGSVQLGTNDDLYPGGSSANASLGSASFRWNDIYGEAANLNNGSGADTILSVTGSDTQNTAHLVSIDAPDLVSGVSALFIEVNDISTSQEVFTIDANPLGGGLQEVFRINVDGEAFSDAGFTVNGDTTYGDSTITQPTGGALNVALGGAAGDDFTVDTNVFVVESDNNWVGINTATPGAEFDIAGQDTSGSTEYINFRSQGLTHTLTFDIATQRYNQFLAPTLEAASVTTLTNLATVYIEDAPDTSDIDVFPTNSYALWVDGGTSKFDSSAVFGGDSVTTGNVVEVTANALTSGKGISVTSTGSGSYNTGARLLDLDHTAEFGSGKSFNTSDDPTLFRANRDWEMNGSGTLTLMNPLAEFIDSGTQTSGSFVHGSDVVRIVQYYASSSGNGLNIAYAGTGNALRVNDTSSILDSTPFVIDNNGDVGIGTDSPATKLDVEGNVQINLSGTQTSVALCGSHTTGGGPAFSDVEIVDCTGTPGADYMEFYPVASGLQKGTIVATGSTAVTTDDGDTLRQLVASTESYQGNLIGILSNPDDAGDFNSIGYNIADADNPQPVALKGRVITKVSTENGSIQPGDPITSSSVAGVGMKATKPGMIVGYALDSWSGAGTGEILVFAGVGFHSGEVIGNNGVVSTFDDNFVFTETGTATSSTQGVASKYLAFRGSGWDSATSAAVERSMNLKTKVTDADNYRLSVLNNSDAEVAYVTNEGDLVLSGKLFPSDRGTAQTSKYVFYDGSAGPGGDFMRTNAAGWATGSYDFAEMFPSKEQLKPGDVVVFATQNREHVRKSSEGYDTKIAGIVSTRPGFLAGDNKAGHYPIALAGRVPTKVTIENGSIQIGDPLTTSASKPGYAMKATKPGQVIGYALEPYDGTGARDRIITFVNASYYGGTSLADAPGTSNTASGSTGGGTNLTSLTMEGNIYLQGFEIRNVGRISGLSNRWVIDGEGNFTTKGLIKTVIKSHQNEDVETVATTSPDVVVTLVGTSKLQGGQATIKFEDIKASFNDVISTVAPIRVIVTPSGPVSLYVSEKDMNGFTVQQVGGSDTGVEFDWMVTAYRKDYEPKDELNIEAPAEEPTEEPVDSETGATTEEPVDTTEATTTDTGTEEQPVDSTTSEPTTEEPAVDSEPVVEEPVAEEPAPEPTPVEEPVEETVTEPPAEEPAPEPVVEETVEEPAAEEAPTT